MVNETHFVLLTGTYGSEKKARIFYLEDHLWDYIDAKIPEITINELDTLEDTGSVNVANGKTHLVEMVECNCGHPELHVTGQFTKWS